MLTLDQLPDDIGDGLVEGARLVTTPIIGHRFTQTRQKCLSSCPSEPTSHDADDDPVRELVANGVEARREVHGVGDAPVLALVDAEAHEGFVYIIPAPRSIVLEAPVADAYPYRRALVVVGVPPEDIPVEGRHLLDVRVGAQRGGVLGGEVVGLPVRDELSRCLVLPDVRVVLPHPLSLSLIGRNAVLGVDQTALVAVPLDGDVIRPPVQFEGLAGRLVILEQVGGAADLSGVLPTRVDVIDPGDHRQVYVR